MKNYECKKLISIIIPIYNSEKYIKKCINSVIEQSYKNIEIILVNDGSTDNSLEICKSYKKIDSRIRIINQKNKGTAAARNVGIKKSKGEYICFVDSDDEIKSNYVEYLLYLINKNDCDIAIASYTVKSGKKEYDLGIGYSEKIINQKECLQLLLNSKGFTVSLCSKLFKRNVFDCIIFPEGYMYEDDATIYEIILNCEKISYGNKSIYTYYVRNNSVMTSNFSNKRLILLKYADKMKSDILSKYPELNEFVEKKYISYNFSLLRQLVNSDLNKNQKEIKKRIINFLKRKKWLVLFSKNYNIKEKFAMISLLFGEKIYKICWNFYEKIKY